MQQVQQGSASFYSLFPGFLSLSHEYKVLILLFQGLSHGCRDLQAFTGELHLSVHPIYAFPQELYVGRITDIRLITGGILQNHIGLFYVGLPWLKLPVSCSCPIT